MKNINALNKKKNIIIGILVSILRWLLVILVGYIILFPLFTMISTSLKTADQVIDPGVVWIPRSISFDNFKAAWTAMEFGKSFIKTMYINIFSAVIEIFVCAITAYGFSRHKFKSKSFWMAVLFVTMIVPPQMTVIPSYVQYQSFDVLGILRLIGDVFDTELRSNLINTPFTFIFPALFSVGIRSSIIIFIYIQFFKALPKELEEAAFVDGAGTLKTFFRIIMPSSAVAIITVSVFAVVWYYNEYYYSAIFFSSDFTLAPNLSQLYTTLISSGVAEQGAVISSAVMAGCLMFIVPPLVFYIIVQRKFIESITTSGIVG